MFRCPSLVLAAAAATLASARARAQALPPPAAGFDFMRDVRPILESKCVGCHGAEKQKGKLRVDSREGLLKGGENGPALVPGKGADSAAVKFAARVVEDMEMPPDEEDRLTPAQVGILRAWVDAGAPWPSGLRLVSRVAASAKGHAAAPLPPPVARKVAFVADVQPILAAHCQECHGPKKQEMGLRLDHKATMFGQGDRAAVVVPGKSAESLLVQMVAGQREAMMPQGAPRLTDEQIGILRAWIDQGADFPDSASAVIEQKREHWAFQPVRRPPVPRPRNPAWVRNPIDAFVLARLEKEGLTPSPEADRVTLLRRLWLDLVGLPPPVGDVDAFLADARPDAWDRAVERLLASPHYGERWGRHWLDAARYADSDGFEKDKPRVMWFYRDWVIGALNRDLPYDRFLTEQLAGDLLPNPTQDQIVATGFLRNSMINEEGGVDPEQFRMEALFDRMDAIGKSMLGLTVQCAQCHSHKFDPISHEEYYRLLAFLNSDDEPFRTVYTAEQQRARGDVLRKIRDVEVRLQRQAPDWKARMERWEDELARKPGPRWTVVQAPFIDDSTGGAKYLMQKDGSWLQQGYAPTKHNAQVVVKTDVKGIRAFQLELLTDPNLPAGGPGRSYKGTGALTDFEVEAAPADQPEKKVKVKLVSATADFEQSETPLEPIFDDKSGKRRVVGPVSYAIDGKEETAWGIDAGPGRRNVARKAVFVAEAPIGHPSGTLLTFTLKQRHGGWNSDDIQTNNLGRFRLSVTDAAAAADPLPARVRAALAVPRGRRSVAQTAEIFSHFRTTVPAWKKANDEIEALWRQHPEGTTALVLQTRPGGRQTHLLKRGDFLKPGKPVAAGVPAALNPLPAGAPPTRLGLARWLTDRRAPTTARVIVNRIWQAYFGTGIVATSEDFGTQAEAPSHPELLDWLAAELMDRGWRLKEVHRLITRSATYRQASRVTPGLLNKDPYNRLLARAPRLRVEGEIVRDLFLASSGLLNTRLGGRSVMPPAPAFLFQPPTSYAPFPWIDETGPDKYRRAVYTYRRRSTPYPLLQTFDAPTAETSCVRRVRSNTPLQALITLNEPMSMEAAQALARRMVEAEGDERARVSHGFRRVLSRTPTATEVDELVGLLARQRKRVADGWADGWQIATGKSERPHKLPAGVTPTDLAAYTIVARAILNLDEAITKE